MNCSKCGQPNDVDAEFCENCGSPLRRTCSHCGARLKPDARFCKKCGAPVSAPGTDRLASLQKNAPPELQAKLRTAAREGEGERKPVTILFTDIVGSTSLAEKLDPEEWKEIVNGAHQLVSQAVYRYEGTIAQLLGDGVLAFFGAPITHEDDPLRAVLAGLDIQRLIGEYERQIMGVVKSFQMRVGVNTGEVVVGSVGSDLHMEYLAIGDAVNLAARLQSAAQPGKVLISQDTARLVQAAVELKSLGEIIVKGKAKPVAVFEVEESKAALVDRHGYAMLRSPLVGRVAELEALQQALDQLKAGLGGVVSITGEAGIGKSRLVEEARLAAPAKARWLEGRALSYGQNLSFWSIRQLLLDDLGLSDGDPEVRLRLALRKRCEALFASESGQVLPYLAQLLGVQLEGDLAEKVKMLDGETVKHQTLVSIARYLTRMAQEQPTVLVFDDLHWADPSSLEALERLLPLTDRVPILILLIARLEREHPSWKIKLKAESEYAHRYTGIELKPLPEDDQNRLVDSLLLSEPLLLKDPMLLRDDLLPRDNRLAIAGLPGEVRQRILERAEGNPLFLEEVVRHLVEQGAIVQVDGAWQVRSDIQSITIPDTLRGVLLARIDRLQDDVRRTLQLAAVIGRSFLFRLLEAIAEAETQLESHLAQLQRLDLVREKSRLPDLEYMFKHSLTQEAAYDSLLVANRKQFHLQVGLALEKLFAGRREEYLGLLAHHFDAAGEAGKAIDYLIEAGDQARLSDEVAEAVGYYRRAIELLSERGEDARSAHAWLKLGLVYTANFQFKDAYRAYEQAFDLTPKTRNAFQAERTGQGHVLRICGFQLKNFLDPGTVISNPAGTYNGWLFSGLARVDEELNVIPDVARSWQVMDAGLRYVFHLREEVRWTDGSPVTAFDFEWAWKRNLHPSFSNQNSQLLYSVVGAQAFSQGADPDPQSVGVRAVDDLTLEVSLINPVAYFPYIVTMPPTYPLPRGVIDRYGEDWCKPEHLVSNGAYRLVEFSPETGFTFERNHGYHGEFPGNVDRVEYKFIEDPQEAVNLFLRDQADLTEASMQLASQVSPEERHPGFSLNVAYLFMNPMLPPFGEVRLRRALSLAIDRERLERKFDLPVAMGGFIPPGMPGHSPDLAPHYDPELARRLLAEAGYPGGRGLPVIQAAVPSVMRQHIGEILAEIIEQWNSELGIQIDPIQTDWENRQKWPLAFLAWVADFPDPENFMRQSTFIYYLKQYGWVDDEYEALVETAAHLPDRAQRMAFYRQADRLVIVDQALVVPLLYSTVQTNLVKKRVKNIRFNRRNEMVLQNIVIEDLPSG